MKNKLFIISLILAFDTPYIQACDICGCAIGNGFSSVLPQFHKNFIGLRGSISRFESQHPDDNSTVSYEKSLTTELWGRYYMHKRVQLIATLPFNFKTQTEGTNTIRSRGIGDLSISMNYTLINHSRDSFKLKHLLLIGIGVKLPTGKQHMYSQDGLMPIAMQPGSGSIDYLYNLTYTIRRNKTGLSNDIQYRINNENNLKYAFGNKLSISSRLFYWKNFRKNLNVVPGTGVLIEQMNKDYLNGYVQTETGGHLYSATASCELYYKKLLVSCYYAYPLSQNLSNRHITSYPKLQFNTCFLF